MEAWSHYLKPSGWLAISECHWLTNKPPEAARAFWTTAYPEMSTAERGRQAAREAGYEVIDTLLLPEQAWFADYYDPLEARMAEVKPTAGDELRTIIENLEREIQIRRHFGDSFGYAFHIFRRPAISS